jgi:hypothetical protein
MQVAEADIRAEDIRAEVAVIARVEEDMGVVAVATSCYRTRDGNVQRTRPRHRRPKNLCTSWKVAHESHSLIFPWD